MLQQRKQLIRAQIKQEQRMAYFTRRRWQKLQELAHSQEVESISEEDVLRGIYQQPSRVDFDSLFQYIRVRENTTDSFSLQITQQILTFYRTNQSALSTLCLLLETKPNLQRLLQEHSSVLKQLLEDNLENMDNLYPSLMILYKVLRQADQKESFSWLPPFYPAIINRMRYGNLALLLLAEGSKCFALLPSFEAVSLIADRRVEEENQDMLSIICEMLLRCFWFHPTLQYFGLLVVWTTSQLKECNLNASLHAMLLESLANLFRLESSKEFIQEMVRYNHEILPILLLFSLHESSRIRASVTACLCKIITSTSQELVKNLLEKHPIAEPLVRAFELQLENSTKFDLLSSIALLFELRPESIREFEARGAMGSIWECEFSEVAALREMGCFIIDNFELER